MFGTGQNQNQYQAQDQDQDQVQERDQDQDKDRDWARTSLEGLAPLDESCWSGFTGTELDDSRSFTYGR